MSKPIEFAKLSGSGNDFICIDNHSGRFDELLESPERVGHFARSVCRRSLGAGADGLIFASRPEIEGVADVAAAFLECDGSSSELCGNGTACFVHWAIQAGMVSDGEVKVLTPAGVVLGQAGEGLYVRVCIPLPRDIRTDLDVSAAGQSWKCDYAVTGVPHLIAYVDDVRAVDVRRCGHAIRHHEQFQPRGVNANFVQVLETGRLAVRTYEFGVEGETLACGTGSTAAAIMAAMRFGWPEEYLTGRRPVLVRAQSGDVLKVHFVRLEDGSFDDVCLETVVRFLYHGVLHADLAREALGGLDG